MLTNMVFLESFYKILLVLHLIAAFVLAGSLVHNLIIVVKYLRGKFGQKRREKLFVTLSFWSYIITHILGTLIYPAFRIHRRHEYFDQQLPWATGLFEVKEHWAAIGLALIIAYYFLRKNFDPATERQKLFFYVPVCFLLNLIVLYEIIIGSYLAVVKG